MPYAAGPREDAPDTVRRDQMLSPLFSEFECLGDELPHDRRPFALPKSLGDDLVYAGDYVGRKAHCNSFRALF